MFDGIYTIEEEKIKERKDARGKESGKEGGGGKTLNPHAIVELWAFVSVVKLQQFNER